MEPPLKHEREREQLRKQVVADGSGILNYFWPFHPVRLFLDLLWSVLRLFQPLAPHLVPLAVFSVTLPLIILLSIGSGYVVWKSVAVSWETELFLQYGDGGSPYADVTLPNLGVQQPYDISLHLVVPANEANIALGNFMATLTLATPANSTIAAVRKPAIVLPLHASPWSYFYNRPGTIDINLPMLTNFVIGSSRALARIELGRRDQWKTLGEGHGRELAVLAGTLRGVVVHHGIRGIVSRFPLVAAAIAAGIFFFISFVVLAACLMPAVEWHFPPPDDAQHVDEKPRRRRRSRRPEGDEKGKSRARTPRRGDESSSRSRPISTYEQGVKTEGDDDWDPPVNPATTVPVYEDTPSSVRRRGPRQPPENDYFEQ